MAASVNGREREPWFIGLLIGLFIGLLKKLTQMFYRSEFFERVGLLVLALNFKVCRI
jgi:hypothetical protein